MDDIQTNADKIERMIELIEELVGSLNESAYEKAQSISNHDRAIAITSAKIKSGAITYIEDFDGKKIPISGSPANLVPIYAKGICYKEVFNKEAGEAGYKAKITMIDARKAQLNGFQSMNKVIQ